jgi:integrase
VSRSLLPPSSNHKSPSITRTYGTYWRLLVREVGHKELLEVRTSDLAVVARIARQSALRRRNAKDGRSAEENCVAAMRKFFDIALSDGHVSSNPAAAVPKPRRLPNERRALTSGELRELELVTQSGGDDPLLDGLLLRFHFETGARRGGAVDLKIRDLNRGRCIVRLTEKGERSRWQPISPSLMNALIQHVTDRGDLNPDSSVFYYRRIRSAAGSRPLTRRRYNTIAARWQESLPWARQIGVSIHWIRHTSGSADMEWRISLPDTLPPAT